MYDQLPQLTWENSSGEGDAPENDNDLNENDIKNNDVDNVNVMKNDQGDDQLMDTW